MMSGFLRGAVLALALSSCASLASREPDGAVTLGYGQVYFTDSAWKEIDEQTVGALTVDWPINAGQWNYEVGVSYFEGRSSFGVDGSFRSNTTEFNAGLRRRFGPLWSSLNPYLSGGLAALYTETRFRPAIGPTTETDDWNGGLYVAGGAWGLWGDHARVGVELRHLSEEPFNPGDLPLDHTQLTVTLGYGF